MQRLLLICSLLTLAACEFPQAFGEAGDGTRMTRYGHCTPYCDAMMPCDNAVSDDFRNYDDCIDTCLDLTDSVSELASGCETVHQDLMMCLGTLTCEEAVSFKFSGPGTDANCGEEERRMLDCQG